MMSKLQEQQQEIERVRRRLHELVEAKAGNLIDAEVAELSSYLDRLIVEYERQKTLRQPSAGE